MADSCNDYSPNGPTPTKKSVSYFHTKKHALLDFHSYTHTDTCSVNLRSWKEI